MTKLSVWAPKSRQVELDVAGRRTPMKSCDGGWFETESLDVSSSIRYAFRIDGGDARPDPRSNFQPESVHGASQTVDHAEYTWADDDWQPPPFGPGTILYELHIGTFSDRGNFEGACEHLDHLVELGVTHVEVMPIAAAPGTRGWGYDGVSLFAPHVAYGGPAGFKRFVDACHARKLSVILDVVYNHLGPSGNYLGLYGPYFTPRYSTPWGDAINFDGGQSDEVRRFFIDNALMWMRDYHVDGLRLDAVHAMFDGSATHFLEQLASEVRDLECQLGKHLLLVAESDLNDPRLVAPAVVGGYGLDAMWCDDFHHAIHAWFTGEQSGYYEDFGEFEQLATVLQRGVVYDGRYSPHRQRMHGRHFASLNGHQLVVCLQNHDQVGNRARGERIGHLISSNRLKQAAALLLTSPFVPLLFQGEEWAASTPFLYFTDHQEPELAEAVRRGRRREFAAFGWTPEQVPDPQAIETFQQSKLSWHERLSGENADIYAWYRKLVQLRRGNPDLRDGQFRRVRIQSDAKAGWLTIRRGSVVVACNLSPQICNIPIADVAAFQTAAGTPGALLSGAGVTLPAEGVVLLVRS